MKSRFSFEGPARRRRDSDTVVNSSDGRAWEQPSPRMVRVESMGLPVLQKKKHRPGPPNSIQSARNYRSDVLEDEISLKEAFTQSRLAGKYGSVDDSDLSNLEQISDLAALTFECIEQRDYLAPIARTIVSILDKLVWSDENKLVTKGLGGAKPSIRRLTHLELCKKFKYERHFLYSEVSKRKQQEDSLSSELAHVKRAHAVLSRELGETQAQLHECEQDKAALQRETTSLCSRLSLMEQRHMEAAVKMEQMMEQNHDKDARALELTRELNQANRLAVVLRHNPEHQRKIEDLKEKLEVEALTQKRLVERLGESQNSYHSAMGSIKGERKKNTDTERALKEAKLKIEGLERSREEMLRPYTPRPNFEAIYTSPEFKGMDVLDTLMADRFKPTSDQITELLKMGKRRDAHSDALTSQLLHTVDIHNKTKHRLYQHQKQEHENLKTLQEVERRKSEILGLKRAAKTPRSRGSTAATPVPATPPLEQASDGPDKDLAEADKGDMVISQGGYSGGYTKPKTTSKYFIALGTGKEVSSFLRLAGKVRNQHMSKKDCEMCLRDVWAKKIASDEEKGFLDLNLPDFFYTYLKNKYGLQKLIAEWGYNMMDALERFRWDADCDLFLKTLVGEIPEEGFHDQNTMVVHLTQLFIKLDVIRMESERKYLPDAYLEEALRLFFPQKSPDAAEEIKEAMLKCCREEEASLEAAEAAAAEAAGAGVDRPQEEVIGFYSFLFRESRNLNQTEFMEELRDQHVFELENFMLELVGRTQALPKNAEGKVMVLGIENTWRALDLLASVDTIQAHLARGLRVRTFSEGDYNTLVDPGDFMQRVFSASLIKKSQNFNPDAINQLKPVDAITGDEDIDHQRFIDLKKLIEDKDTDKKDPQAVSKSKMYPNVSKGVLDALQEAYGVEPGVMPSISPATKGPNYANNFRIHISAEALDGNQPMENLDDDGDLGANILVTTKHEMRNMYESGKEEGSISQLSRASPLDGVRPATGVASVPTIVEGS